MVTSTRILRTSRSACVSWRAFSTHERVKPEILFQSNHIVVAYKPPGWQSVVMGHGKTDKCLLNYLQKVKRAGGGSDQSFLLPLHRLDQPCSGVQIYGKTRKAASRIQSRWEHVEKTYLVAIQESLLTNLMLESSATSEAEVGSSWMELQALMPRRRHQQSNRADYGQQRGWSVKMLPSKEYSVSEDGSHRLCSLHWRVADTAPLAEQQGDKSAFLEVKTNQGARHMIRAIFACYKCPLVGDVRYGATRPLPDRSVALHARRLVLPETKIKLNLPQRDFIAPIPLLWRRIFGVEWDS